MWDTHANLGVVKNRNYVVQILNFHLQSVSTMVFGLRDIFASFWFINESFRVYDKW